MILDYTSYTHTHKRQTKSNFDQIIFGLLQLKFSGFVIIFLVIIKCMSCFFCYRCMLVKGAKWTMKINL